MTERAQAFLVTLDYDYRVGDDAPDGTPLGADAIAHAISCIKGVAGVETVPVDLEDHMARDRVRTEVRAMLHKAIDRAFEAAVSDEMPEDASG